ncbi:MAG: hypothetical protein HY735_03580 [Verrucomicrobia bacterium]|nr:hypothetical protein [Verrucomicrobiota bacterium]
MNLRTETFHFTFLTACFSGGAEGKEAKTSELRVPPVRGHIRFWHRATFGVESANRVWGSTDGDEGQGSRVAIRIGESLPPSRRDAPLLPHKTHGASRPALPPGATASIQLQRLPACSNDDWQQALTATRIWILAGTLGYRSSRAAGSVWPLESWTPRSRDELSGLLAPLLKKPGNPWAAALAGKPAAKTATALRETASDTPQGPAQLFGQAQPRRPSPVRFKVVELNPGSCLLVLAPSKQQLTAAEAALKSKPSPQRWNDLGAWQPL